MANGIFDPQIMQGSSLKGESFVQQPVAFDPSAGLQQLGEAIDVGVQTHRFGKATEAVEAEKQDFLSDISALRSAETEKAELMKISPVEGAVYQDAQDKIKSLQQAIAARQINPANAISRIESIQREALNRAPMFSQQIRGLTGSGSSEFESVAEQYIKEENFRRDEMVKLNLNPDNPEHRISYSNFVAAKTQSEFLGNMKTIDSRDAVRVFNQQADSFINLMDKGMLSMLSEQPGNASNLPPEMRTEISIHAQTMMNGNEYNILNEMFRQSGFDPSNVDNTTIERLARRIRGKGEALFKIANGEIPKEVAANQLSYLTDQEVLNVAENYPSTFSAMALMTYVPPEALGNTGFANNLGNNLVHLLRSGLENDQEAMKQSSIKKKGGEGTDPAAVQNRWADNLKRGRNAWKGIDNPKPEDISAQTQLIMTTAEAIGLNPKEFTAKSFDEMVATINDEKFMELWNKADDESAAKFADVMRNTAQKFIRDNMAVSMRQELDKPIDGAPKIFTIMDDVAANLTGNKNVRNYEQVRNVVSVRVDSYTGEISFSARSPEYNKYAEKLNKMYVDRTRKSLAALYRLGNIKDQKDKLRVVGGLFSEPLFGIGEELYLNMPQTERDKKLAALWRNDRTGISVMMSSILDDEAEEGGSE